MLPHRERFFSITDAEISFIDISEIISRRKQDIKYLHL